MSKFVAFCLLMVVFMAFLTVGCGIVQNGQPDGKSTGYITVRKTDITQNYVVCNSYGGCSTRDYSTPAVDARHYEFIRPNGEIFEMNFAGLKDAPDLNVGDSLKDLIYLDLKDHKQFFVKAVLDHESPSGMGNIILTQSPSALTNGASIPAGNTCLRGDGTYGACGSTPKKSPKPAKSDAHVVYLTSASN